MSQSRASMVAACRGERCLEGGTESSTAALEHMAPHSFDSTMMLRQFRSSFSIQKAFKNGAVATIRLPQSTLEPFVLTQESATFSV